MFDKSFHHNLDHFCTCQNNRVLYSSFYPISLIINHSSSSLCRWWCRKFIFFLLYTIICTCHLISLIHMWHISHEFLHTYKITSTKHLVCFSLLVTTLSFPFSLHMPLITIFLSEPQLCWSLITTFSCFLQWV